MKIIISLIALTVLASCGHTSKTSEKKYDPKITFSEDGKTFNARVNLPKNFKNPIPLVVIVHEWWGRNAYIDRRSQMLNEEGYATLSVDLFGDSKEVATPTEAQELATPFYKDPQLGIQRLKKYVTMAKKDPHIDPNQVYVIGYCFGGTQALNFARSGADIKGVVSFHGGLTSSLKSQGIKAEILAINGLADPMVPAKDRNAFEKEMKSLNAKFKMINYQGATHAFTNPKATEVGKKYKIPIAYNQKADENSWNELLKFLQK